jgi:hypothetical protein
MRSTLGGGGGSSQEADVDARADEEPRMGRRGRSFLLLGISSVLGAVRFLLEAARIECISSSGKRGTGAP